MMAQRFVDIYLNSLYNFTWKISFIHFIHYVDDILSLTHYNAIDINNLQYELLNYISFPFLIHKINKL